MNMLNKFTSTVSKTFTKAKFKVNKYSPEILLVTGIVGLVGGAVLACRATLKAKDEIDNYNYEKEDIESTLRVPDSNNDIVEYTEDDKKADITKLKMKTALTLVKHYAPAVSISVVSIAALVSSNNIMKKRALALATAYAALDTSFKNYRDRVIERYGEEIDKEIRYGVKHSQVEQTVTNDKGKEKTETVDVTNVDGNPDEFTRIFDSSNKYWDSDPTYIRMFLDSEESRANNLLRVNGIVFLNEIFDRLGFEKTKMGQVIGWKYDPDKDSYIDFGIYMMEDNKKAILKFNPQGYILGELERADK